MMLQGQFIKSVQICQNTAYGGSFAGMAGKICYHLDVELPDGGAHVREPKLLEAVPLSLGRNDAKEAAVPGWLS